MVKSTPTLTPASLATLLDKVPRYPLASVPTPLQCLPRLAEAVGVHQLFVKRDDLTGLAFGGNKVRQLEYFVGDALSSGADTLLGGGSYAQSNHARLCCAAARAASLTPVIVVRPGGPHGDGRRFGNARIVDLMCDDVRVAPELATAPEDRQGEVEARRAVFEAIAEEYREQGHRPYVILGSSVPLGVLGYVRAALELHDQFERTGIEPDWVVVTSLGVTQAGLVLGGILLGARWKVCGMAYMPARGAGRRTVKELAEKAAILLGLDVAIAEDDIFNFDAAAGPAYGCPSPQSKAAMRLAASTEGLVLDPDYTSKGLAGLIAAVSNGIIAGHENVVFVHTGGLPALFVPDTPTGSH